MVSKRDDLSDWGGPNEDNGGEQENGEKAWRLTREKILMFSGLTLVLAEFINSELIGGTFHYEFLIGGLALCGISIAQWGDRR
jgi:hypothetical protein